jgi:hypothetical protein
MAAGEVCFSCVCDLALYVAGVWREGHLFPLCWVVFHILDELLISQLLCAT